MRSKLYQAGVAALACGLVQACDDNATRHQADAAADGGADELDAAPDAEEQEDAEIDAPAPEDAGMDASSSTSVVVRFRGRVGSSDYGCLNEYEGQGSSKARVTGRDFRFFVHNLRLLTATGQEVPLVLDPAPPSQTTELALLDFQNPDGRCGAEASSTRVTGQAPPGDYTGIAFTVGVPETLNHGDPAKSTAPLRTSGLSWGWLQGYRFFVGELVVVGAADAQVQDAAHDASAADAATDTSGPDAIADAAADGGQDAASSGSGEHEFEPGVGVLHTGSTGCIGSPANGISCSKSNRAEVRLTNFDARSQTIIADLGAVFSEVDLAVGAQCHGRGEVCTTMLNALGVDIATGNPLPTQRVFRVE